jgi:predicted ATP-dependent endonuclease of OLD family
MATLHNLKIKNFRGIENFDQNFKKGLTCIIGRGDSGKSTILEALNLVLSSSWTINFYDSDFLNCHTDTPIEIEATLTEIPEKLLAKYGMYVRGITSNGNIIDDMEAEEANNAKDALTVKLTVTKDLEPIWTVVSYREQEPVSISATDRSKMNVLSISDYADKHFSLNKGNPLYTLFKMLEEDGEEEISEGNAILDILRETKTRIDTSIADKFENVIEKVKNTAVLLGIEADSIKTSIDHRDISIKENKVSLHESDIPLRLKGKGARRLMSLAIQLSIANPSGIILIDEIEQGLEPDRVQHLVSILIRETNYQILFTTHSRNVIVELPCNNLYIMRRGNDKLLDIPTDMQGSVRSNPEALFMKKVIVCEGVTEVGICRALNVNRQLLGKINLSCLGIGLVDGGGENMIQRAKTFNFLGYSTCLLCDSDTESIKKSKNELISSGVNIFDCEEGSSIEQQVFADLPWEQIIKLVDYKIEIDGNDSHSLFQSTYSQEKPMPEFNEYWYKTESDELRTLLGNISKKKDWYKRIDHGMKIGEIIFEGFENICESKKIKQIFENLSNWIDS